jgi:hypothetical protein
LTTQVMVRVDSVVAELTLPNPGAGWQLDPTDPLPGSASGSSTVASSTAVHLSAPDAIMPTPTPYLSAPDGTAGSPALTGVLPGVPPDGSGVPLGPSDLPGPLAPTWSSLTGVPGSNSSWIQQMHGST